jgi:hypothetical protein
MSLRQGDQIVNDHLASRKDGSAKNSIVDFVTRITKLGGAKLHRADAAHRHVRQ